MNNTINNILLHAIGNKKTTRARAIFTRAENTNIYVTATYDKDFIQQVIDDHTQNGFIYIKTLTGNTKFDECEKTKYTNFVITCNTESEQRDALASL